MKILEMIKIGGRKILSSRYGFFGNFPSWQAAEKKCHGYDAENILEKVKHAILKVKKGEAAYERDSVLFDEVVYSWPLLAALMWVGALRKGNLNVLDFGGSLGSSYFQNKKFLDSLDAVRWSIIEQERFVTCGKEHLEDGRLGFFYTIQEAVAQNGLPDIVVISCTLPYLKDPLPVLKELLSLDIPYLLIDNTYFNYEKKKRICIQKVPSEIYEASYPCWFLNYEEVKEMVETKYTIISEHTNDSYIYLDGRKIQYRGFLAKNGS